MARYSKKYEENVSKEKLSNKRNKTGLTFDPDSEVNNALRPYSSLPKRTLDLQRAIREEKMFLARSTDHSSHSPLYRIPHSRLDSKTDHFKTFRRGKQSKH